MGFKQFLLKENPSAMTITAEGPSKGKQQSMQTEGTVTFGWLGDMLLTAEYNKPVAINGKMIDPQEVKRLRDSFSYIDEEDMETYARDTYRTNIQYHEHLVGYVTQYLGLVDAFKLQQGGEKINRSDQLWEERHKYAELHDAARGSRDGMIPAGRLFKDIKGISFYGKASAPKVKQLLQTVGESPHGYVIEERDGMNIRQFPLDEPRMSSKGDEEDELKTTQLAKMRLRDMQRNKTMGKKKDIFQHYKTTQGG